VLVTIDDLAALLEICQRHANETGRQRGVRTSACQVNVFFAMKQRRSRDILRVLWGTFRGRISLDEFNSWSKTHYAGSFPQASDMKKLSDAELKWLRVQSPQVRVIQVKQ
jgi:hypothetical protein